jgi:hypothetical protein
VKGLTTRQRLASTVFGLVVVVGIGPLFVGFGALFAIPLVIVLLVGGNKVLPGFWRTLGGSALAGAMAGILVLGPGLRIAMRVVAMAEPTQTPEFSVGGTVGIIVVLGAIFGSTIAVAAMFITNGFDLGRIQTALLFSLGLMGILLVSPDLRDEIFGLGYGGWFNLSMFGFVGFLFGLVTQNFFTRLKFATIQQATCVETMA